MVTGFIRLNGMMTVGAVANLYKVYAEDGTEAASFDCALTVDGCKKAVDFVNFCDAFSIPGAHIDKCRRIFSYARL